MIFQHTYTQVMNGTKTQTRRIVTPNQAEYELRDSFTNEPLGIVAIGNGKRWLWRVGHTYAVQPGRGKREIGRIRVIALRREDVREISDIDVRAEGFSSREAFLDVWCQMHDKRMYHVAEEARKRGLPGYSMALLAEQPHEHYDAWVIEFERIKEAS